MLNSKNTLLLLLLASSAEIDGTEGPERRGDVM
jgi:hypothetical protein